MSFTSVSLSRAEEEDGQVKCFGEVERKGGGFGEVEGVGEGFGEH